MFLSKGLATPRAASASTGKLSATWREAARCEILVKAPMAKPSSRSKCNPSRAGTDFKSTSTRRDNGGERALARLLRAERAFGIVGLNQDGLDGRRLQCRSAVVLEQPGVHQPAVFPKHFFLKCLAEPHPDRALDLAFDRQRVDGLSAIVRGHDAVHRNFARMGIHGHLDRLRAVAIGG